MINDDQVWKTYCELHNMLLEFDGLDDLWNDFESPDDRTANSFAIRRLRNPRGSTRYMVTNVEDNVQVERHNLKNIQPDSEKDPRACLRTKTLQCSHGRGRCCQAVPQIQKRSSTGYRASTGTRCSLLFPPFGTTKLADPPSWLAQY